MFRKVTSVLLVLLFSWMAGKCFADTSVDLEQAKSNIVSLVNGGNYAQAQAETQKVLVDFPQNPALPQVLFEIAQKFRWSGVSDRDKDKYGRAQKVYQQIITNYPDSPFANKAALGIAKTKVLYFIVTQDYNAAGRALNEMVASFPKDPNLPDELYWIGRGYGYWERHEEEKGVYQRIIQNYPDSPWADRARIGFAKANVQSLIMSKDYDAAKQALDRLTADFPKHPDLPEELYWIAERYNWVDKYEEAKGIHQKIIKDFPDSSFVTVARLGFSKADVLSLMVSKEYENGEKAFDELFTDFKSHPDLPRAVLAIGEQCYKQGLSKQDYDPNQAKDLYGRAAKVWDRLINELPDSSLVPEACCWAGDCYHDKLNKYEDSIRCFQKVVDKYPKYQHASHAQFTVGRCYEALKETGAVDKAVADEKIKAAYEKVIQNYPDCQAATYVNNWLSSQVKAEEEK